MLQCLDCIVSPVQVSLGHIQVRFLVWEPEPQEVEHSDQSDHWSHCRQTASVKQNLRKFLATELNLHPI